MIISSLAQQHANLTFLKSYTKQNNKDKRGICDHTYQGIAVIREIRRVPEINFAKEANISNQIYGAISLLRMLLVPCMHEKETNWVMHAGCFVLDRTRRSMQQP